MVYFHLNELLIYQEQGSIMYLMVLKDKSVTDNVLVLTVELLPVSN